jgi:hypothetical protein
MGTDSSGAEATTHEEAVPGKAGRPPPTILTSKTNLIQLLKQLKNVVKDDFEFRSTRNGTRVTTKTRRISKPSNFTSPTITSPINPFFEVSQARKSNHTSPPSQ